MPTGVDSLVLQELASKKRIRAVSSQKHRKLPKTLLKMSQARGSSLDGYDVEAARGSSLDGVRGSSLDGDDVETVVIIKKKIVRTTLPDGSVITTTEPATGSAPKTDWQTGTKSGSTIANHTPGKRGESTPSALSSILNFGWYMFFPFVLIW